MKDKPSIRFYSGVGTVTGANFLFKSDDGHKILIDCGMIQGEHFAEMTNSEDFDYEPSSIEALIVTHAHLDHVGRIPKLVKDGFRGKIYSTPQTMDLAQLVLEDAVRILAEEAKRDKKEPIYSAVDVESVFPLWETFEYHKSFAIGDSVKVVLKDAGHILGSAMVEIENSGKKILFSGDLGNSPAPLLRDTEPAGDIDYLIIESTYGDRNHETRERRTQEFEKIIKDTITRGGTLLIPAFSIDRTQVLLYELNNMVEQKRIPKIPVFVDSPLATKATEVYTKNTDLFNESVKKQMQRGDNVLSFPHLSFTINQHESKEIDRIHGPKIILAGSGMSAGGRIISHEAHYLPDPRNTILLVGYQTVGSLGRRLSEGAKEVNIHGQTVPVNASVQTIYGYSAHKDGDHLFEFVTTATDRLKQIFVVMGEPSASMYLAQRFNNELNVKAFVPDVGRIYELN